MPDASLAVVVEKPRAEAAIGALRAEGVYDDARSVYECGDETVAIPVRAHPETTDVIEVVRDEGERRLRTLEDHLRERGWTEDELEQTPGSWAVVGSVVLVDVGDAPRPDEVGDALLALHGQADTVLAREGVSGEHREPSVAVIAGEGDTETVHVEHGTTYAMDLAEVMFSPGNKAERARMGEVTKEGERVLDAFAGIGYFALPMARAGAEVTAVERNPVAFEYLLENAVRNDVQDRLHAYRGDNREVVPELTADGAGFERAVLGYYEVTEPRSVDSQTTSGQSWAYLDALLPAVESGGAVHLHEATPEGLIPDRPVDRLTAAADDLSRSVEVLDVREVKGYSEGVAHVVVDARVE